MRKVFRSKIGLELAIPITIVLGIVMVLTMREPTSWLGVTILLPLEALILHIFLATSYTIEGDRLTIKCGILFHKVVDIKAMKKVAETRNLLSSPALSLDRLEITYGESDSIIISPKHKREFIDTIVSLNPNVQVELTTK